MAISYSIRKDEGLVISKHEGATSDHEMITTYKAMFDDPDYKGDFHHLVDLRLADSSNRGANALRSLSKLVQQYRTGKDDSIKTAIIAPKNLSFGLGRMYGLLMDKSPEDIMVFRDVDAALEWLGISPDVIEDS